MIMAFVALILFVVRSLPGAFVSPAGILHGLVHIAGILAGLVAFVRIFIFSAAVFHVGIAGIGAGAAGGQTAHRSGKNQTESARGQDL